jgi:hypothetical protein
MRALTKKDFDFLSYIRNVYKNLLWHAQQVGHDRCWLDDELVCEESLPHRAPRTTLPCKKEFMQKCAIYKIAAHSDQLILLGDLLHKDSFDYEALLSGMSPLELMNEAWLYAAAVARFERVIVPTRDDYVHLYSVLPEARFGFIQIDVRLPDDLLEGCERFYDTRPIPITRQKLHEW